MGGPCWLLKPNGQRSGAPDCTDNFQISKFEFRGTAYHSVEQAFQCLKFTPGSATSRQIQAAHPRKGEDSRGYGMRMWQEGQSRADKLMENFEDVKVALMYALNAAKFVSTPSMQSELVTETGEMRIDGGASTWEWQKWNGLIHMLLRQKIKQGVDLQAEASRDFADLQESAKIMAEMEALCVPEGSNSED
jgi:predicted NAD-dependent protein-ADP-ribosyltransferase YbiA (DUF1768 family)